MQVQNSHYQQRTAFVLNENAKSVTDRLVRRLMPLIPAGDLYCSRGLNQAKDQYRWILEKGYGQVFCGGGDGTAMSAINMLNLLAAKLRVQLPRIGILKLGTGNALASVLNAKKAARDVEHILNGGRLIAAKIGMVECEDGTMAPFAGMGHDALVLNDYNALKRQFEHTKLRPVACSLLGYLFAIMSMSIPRHLALGSKPLIKISSSKAAHKIVHVNGKDEKIYYPAGTTLYEGPASIVSVGSIKVFGFNFTMFPFVGDDPHLIQVRVSPCPIPTLFSNLYPIWRGTFRHPDLHDFLVSDVIVESNRALPYQVGGDACGYRNRALFKAAQKPIEMVQLQRTNSENRPLLAAPHFG